MARISPSSMSSGLSPSDPHPAPVMDRDDNDAHRDDPSDQSDAPGDASTPLTFPYGDFLPGASKDLSWIAVQAFGLGGIVTSCLLGTGYALYVGWTGWRLSAFFFFLAVFHFLEFYTTARWNLPVARADSFLLFNNGRAYTIAHGMATLEIIVAYFLPSYQVFLTSRFTLVLGILLVGIGQFTRSYAMAQAGTNFNHTIQQERKNTHELVTGGIYRYLRHPSYFGFFYWALGTQLIVGNKICLVGYAVVLWRFFDKRIRTEESYLSHFFGTYEEYKKQTGTMIPFIP